LLYVACGDYCGGGEKCNIPWLIVAGTGRL